MAESDEFQCEGSKHANADFDNEWCNVNLECPDHSKQYDFYCPVHDSVVCDVCVELRHIGCEDLRPLDDAAKNVSTPFALTDLEQNMDELLENIVKGVQHLQKNQKNLKKQEEVTKKLIATKRAEINKHLDTIEEKLLKELKSKAEEAMTDISLMTTKFETKQKYISDLKDTAQHMKQFSSSLQRFVGIRSIMKTVVDEINKTKRLLSTIPQQHIAVQINPKFETLTEASLSLGEIQITSKQAVIPYIERRFKQAEQERPAEPPVHILDNLQLKLRTNINMGETNSNVTSCLILPNKYIMIASKNKPSLTILKEDGSHDREINIPYNPYHVTLIDEQRVAVSYFNKCLTIVNLKTQKTKQIQKKLCGQWICGITYNDGKLYAVTEDEGIKVINLDWNIIKTIPIYDRAKSTHKVATLKDKIYCPVYPATVYCGNTDGTQIWMYKDDRLFPSSAIAVDNYGITFAACISRNLLLAISPDGKNQKVLLTIDDGLRTPNAVHYDQDSKRLLVCNEQNGHAALYDVNY